MLKKIKEELKKYSNKEKAKILQGFFKTGKGQYGEGDVFIGVTVPQSRTVAKKYTNLSFEDTNELLRSEIHEERLVALLILVERFKEGNNEEKENIVDFYLKNTNKVNNWDLVDLSADKIIGEYLFDKNTNILRKLAKSKNLWERRIAIVATFHFIKNNKFDETLKIAEILLRDKHDLIHKAVGWMLREVGKRNQQIEEQFLKKQYKRVPRTMLRYAVERFDAAKKEFYLKK